MKKIFSIALSLAMLVTSSGMVVAEENQALKNLKDNNIKKIMQNTLIIRPGALNAFAYGKNYSLEEFGEATKEIRLKKLTGKLYHFKYYRKILKTKDARKRFKAISEFFVLRTN